MDELTQQAQQGWLGNQATATHTHEYQELLHTIGQATDAILLAASIMSETTKTHEPSVTVKNPIESVATPDVDKVVTAIDKLTEIESKEQDLSPIVDGLKALLPALEAIPGAITIPEAPETVTVSNLGEIVDELKAATKAIVKASNVVIPTPQVTVEPTPVTVQEKEVDLSPILGALEQGFEGMKTSIASIPQVDNSPIIAAAESTTSAIQNLRFPIPNFIVDPTIKYRPADLDNTDTVRYFGFTDVSGGWYIMKEDTTTNPTSIRYTRADTGYIAAWTGRSGLTYYYFHEIF